MGSIYSSLFFPLAMKNMMVMTKSTIGGTITQNFVQNGIFIPPSVVRPSIEKKLAEINKKWHALWE